MEPFGRDIPDLETGETFIVAARPGTVDVPDKLGRALLKQDGWAAVDDKPAKAEKEKS